ncbi:DNA-binding protein [Candidatus Spongiihabitans sp.]|uniref:DNA-binding protein n=1 Tax=Candidatus Spongiihabitans sp. TaxID=3101308 RepID=UPI003C7B1422
MPTLQFHGWNAAVFTFGDIAIAERRKTAFLCSRKYPARAVLPIYDWAKAMRDAGECVMSGFHSRLERDLLDILIKGDQPIILATARGLPKRYPVAVKQAIDDGKLLVTSPFPASVSRITAGTSRHRNAFMLSVAERIVIGHMSQTGILAEALSSVALHKEIIRLSEE